jgi:ADP-ribose pyrophosphatase YjhB (NUDIX family)
MDKAVKTVVILVFRDESVLIIGQGDESHHVIGTYGLPGGRVEDGEIEKEAAVRELKEETELLTDTGDMSELPGVEYFGDMARKDGNKISMSMKVFLCRKYQGEPKITEEGKPIWVPINTLSGYNLLPNVQDAVNKGLEFLKNNNEIMDSK